MAQDSSQGAMCWFRRLVTPARRRLADPNGSDTLLSDPRPGAHNSAVECHLHTVEVVGSNPAVPTIKSTTYWRFTLSGAAVGLTKPVFGSVSGGGCDNHADKLVVCRPNIAGNGLGVHVCG